MYCMCILAVVNNLDLSVPGVLEAAAGAAAGAEEVGVRLPLLTQLQEQGLKVEPVPRGPPTSSPLDSPPHLCPPFPYRKPVYQVRS